MCRIVATKEDKVDEPDSEKSSGSKAKRRGDDL